MNKHEQINSGDNTNSFKHYLLLKGLSKNTVDSYNRRIVHFIRFRKEQTNSGIQEVDILLDYINKRKTTGLSQKSIAYELHVINHYLNLLQQQNRLKENPVPYIKLQGTRKQSLHTILSNDQLEQVYQDYGKHIDDESQKNMQPESMLTMRLRDNRDKVIVGLMVYQGLDITDVESLDVIDLDVDNVAIHVPMSRLHAPRKLKLEAAQIIDLAQYIGHTREQLLSLSNRSTSKLIFTNGNSNKLSNIFRELLYRLRRENKNLVSAKQVRTSVIVHWLKQYGLRRTQYMAGHKHISATEAYKVYITEQLAEHIERFHPLNSTK